MDSKYNPTEIEARWYQYWLDNKLFHSEPDGREPYTIVIPPPNVTGVLHMGHVLNETIQDILVRRARLEGKNACWVPGTDHASIATEAKVIKRLKEQGINKSDLTREQFLKHAWDWTDEHGGIILKQLRKLGCSCDWDRTSFTMDETRSKAVIHVFCDLFAAESKLACKQSEYGYQKQVNNESGYMIPGCWIIPVCRLHGFNYLLNSAFSVNF